MFLISYEVVISFKELINNFMIKFAADKLTNINILENYVGLIYLEQIKIEYSNKN